ncbi:MAG: DUF2333 family protein [Desulfobacterales bacterium]
MKFFGKKTEGNDSGKPGGQETGPEDTKKFTPKRIIIGMFLTVVFLWVIVTVIGFFVPSTPRNVENNQLVNDNSNELSSPSTRLTQNDSTDKISDTRSTTSPTATPEAKKNSASPSTDASQKGVTQFRTPETLPVPKKSNDTPEVEEPEPQSEPAPTVRVAPFGDRRPGIAVTEAIIEVLEYELKGRFWGWRVNDLVQITDNVQHYQLGVLEVSRRAIPALAERMSRTGSTALYDPNLEMAMNWIMVKAGAYWFPSAESKYKEAIADLKTYRDRLEKGTADFYTRTDNLIPLLASFEDLLGSCDENLLKMKESDGSKVSFFKADDYFYYTKGVIESMHTILEAVREDFFKTLDSRRSVEIIDHALKSLEHGEHIHPWIVLNSKLSSIFANHRSNLAGPVSHARFHIGLLIKALST